MRGDSPGAAIVEQSDGKTFADQEGVTTSATLFDDNGQTVFAELWKLRFWIGRF